MERSERIEMMADRVQRPKPQGGDYRPHYRKREADAYMDYLEIQLDNYRLTFRAIERESKRKEESISNLETELRDTRRALEIALESDANVTPDCMEQSVADYLDMARNERTEEINGNAGVLAAVL